MKSLREKKKRNRWLLAFFVLFAVVGAGLWQRGSDGQGPFMAYADSTKPSLVFLYTSKPHIMPDGSEML